MATKNSPSNKDFASLFSHLPVADREALIRQFQRYPHLFPVMTNLFARKMRAVQAGDQEELQRILHEEQSLLEDSLGSQD